MAPIGIALVGGGLFAQQEHMPAIMKTDIFSLKAIYSRSLKSAEKTASLNTSDSCPDLYSSDSGAGKSYEDLLARDDVKAVILALPIMAQPEHIEAALSAGKHVLAEKPIAPDVAGGKKLIAYYRDVAAKNNVTFSIAENYRFKPSFLYAAEQAGKFGPVEQFNVRVNFLMSADSQWYATEWRKTPEYQGGFLLDGGVHFTAAARMMLADASSRASTVRALTTQVQPHLPPIDTVNAVIRTKGGAIGAFNFSCGSQLSAFTYDFAYKGGVVSIDGDKVTVQAKGGEKTSKDFERTSGVSEEVACWAQGLRDGKQDGRQTPEEALADLEFLQAIFESGDNGGEEKKYELQ